MTVSAEAMEAARAIRVRRRLSSTVETCTLFAFDGDELVAIASAMESYAAQKVKAERERMCGKAFTCCTCEARIILVSDATPASPSVPANADTGREVVQNSRTLRSIAASTEHDNAQAPPPGGGAAPCTHSEVRVETRRVKVCENCGQDVGVAATLG